MSILSAQALATFIGILAAVALPAYRDYTQNAANGACLKEATTYVSATAGLAADPIVTTIPAFVPSACTSGTDMTTALYNGNSNMAFVTPTKGNAAKKKNPQCEASTAKCTNS